MQVISRTIIISSLLIVCIGNAQETSTADLPAVPTDIEVSQETSMTPSTTSTTDIEQALEVPTPTQDIGSESVIDQLNSTEQASQSSDAQPALPDKPVSEQGAEKPLEFPPVPQEQRIIQPGDVKPEEALNSTSEASEVRDKAIESSEGESVDASTQSAVSTELISDQSTSIQTTSTEVVEIPKNQPVVSEESTQSSQPKDLEEKELKQQSAEERPEKAENTTVETSESEAQQPAQEILDAEIKGLDTVDLSEPQGNWLFKRIWWERAEEKFEKIRAAVDSILESRLQFLTKRVAIERDTLDPFFITTGLSQGEMDQVLSQLIAYLQNIKEDDVKEGQNLLSTLLEEKKNLEQLKQDVQSVVSLNNELDIVLAKIIEQINKMRVYEEESWKAFKEISRVLSDKRARELFYIMNTYARNINDIQIYIDKTLGQHFSMIEEKMKSVMDKIDKAIAVLKEKGIDFKKQTEEIQKAERERLATSCSIKREEQEETAVISQKGTVEVIGSYITSTIASIWDSIKYVVQLPIQLFYGKQSQKTDRELDLEEEARQAQEASAKQSSEETESTAISASSDLSVSTTATLSVFDNTQQSSTSFE